MGRSYFQRRRRSSFYIYILYHGRFISDVTIRRSFVVIFIRLCVCFRTNTSVLLFKNASVLLPLAISRNFFLLVITCFICLASNFPIKKSIFFISRNIIIYILSTGWCKLKDIIYLRFEGYGEKYTLYLNL